MLSSVIPERSFRKYSRYLLVNFGLTSSSAAAVAAVVAVFSPWLVRLYGVGFAGGAGAFALLSVATVLMAMNICVGQAIWSLDAPRAGMILALMRGGVLVVVSYPLAYRGAEGLALAYLVMGIAQTAVSAPFMVWLLSRTRREWDGSH
jgi:O-antigen/teichoic acid export membrane protein